MTVVDPPQEGNIMDDSAIQKSAMTVAEELENSNSCAPVPGFAAPDYGGEDRKSSGYC